MRELNALAERYNINLERQDYHAALICALLANIYRDSDKKPEPFQPSDFMPQREMSGAVEQPQAAPHEELDDLLAFGRALGAGVVVHG